MRVLVTGGAGFIGSHVAEASLEAGHVVTCLDDLSSGKRENVPEGARLLVADIRSEAALRAIVEAAPDVLVHHAAQMDVRRSVADPGFDADVNVRGTLNLLEACLKAGTRRVLFASTGGAIYGEQEVFPASEDHPTRPVSPYGCSKAAVEIYLRCYEALHGLSWMALRYANVYGPRQDPHGEAGVVAIFARRLLAGEPCTVFGDGHQTRDYVYVEDVARANVLALGSEATGPLNIGTGIETDVLTLHGALAAAAGAAELLVHADPRPGEQRRSSVDPRRAETVLGWRPTVDLAEGSRRTLGWFRQHPAGV
jgi:UDP-glucose 4-epimerase